jgi:hypothetical protein
MSDRCEFRTQTVKGALSQSARRGSALRDERCRNRATHTIKIVEVSLAWRREREVRCCGTHKRKHDEQGWLP